MRHFLYITLLITNFTSHLNIVHFHLFLCLIICYFIWKKRQNYYWKSSVFLLRFETPIFSNRRRNVVISRSWIAFFLIESCWLWNCDCWFYSCTYIIITNTWFVLRYKIRPTWWKKSCTFGTFIYLITSYIISSDTRIYIFAEKISWLWSFDRVWNRFTKLRIIFSRSRIIIQNLIFSSTLSKFNF